MNEFKSILFDDFGPEFKKSKLHSCVYKDLNLDQIISAIISSKKEYDLQPFFYTPLKNKKLILYRQNIMKDLEKQSIFDIFKEFEADFKMLKESLENSNKLNFIYQKASWFLDAVLLYSDLLKKFFKSISNETLHSQGLLSFRLYLGKYLKSDKFISLSLSAKNLDIKLKKIRYCLDMQGSCIKLEQFSNQKNYEEEIEVFFKRFTKNVKDDYKVEFDDYLDLNHVEEKVVKMLSKLYPDNFYELEEFYKNNSNFMNTTIQVFEREIQFYISFLEYLKMINQNELSFCYPEILTDKKEVFGNNVFDMMLASKATKNDIKIVRNDFYLKNQERIIVVTGPNQGGKTTFARSVGELFYFASLGCKVASSSARVYMIDSIFTHFEKEEDITNLRSKLEDDIFRAKEILDEASPKSLVIVNEIFTSTTLEDATALSKNILDIIIKKDLFCVWVTFIDEISRFDKRIVSMVSQVDTNNHEKKTYKIIRHFADGKAYAMAIAKKYSLTYEDIVGRIK